LRIVPAVACSCARWRAIRTWPRIWLSPTTIESRPGRYPEQVGDGRLVVVHEQVAYDGVAAGAGALGEDPGDVLHAAVEPVDRDVHLDPVAGGDHDRLADVLAVEQVGAELAGRLVVERHPLEDVDGGRTVRDPYDEDAHALSTSRRRGGASRPGAPAPWVFRCSW
jgi:hypothetical protein